MSENTLESRSGIKKGIILAGGAGTRLYPATKIVSKQFQTVYDKPMIYYPLTTLMLSGIRSILIISTPHDLPRFAGFLNDGSQWGIQLSYRVQERPKGIAHAFLVGEDFIGNDPICLILGDNIFYGYLDFLRESCKEFNSGAVVFAYYVKEPSRYGIVEFDTNGWAVSIDEKPKEPKSNYAVPGLYLYDDSVIEIAKSLEPSARSELEITDVNMVYLKRKQLRVEILGRGMAWLDMGTHSSLLEASNFMAALEARQGLKIGCPEETALRMHYIDPDQMEKLIEDMPDCQYRGYLCQILHEFVDADCDSKIPNSLGVVV